MTIPLAEIKRLMEKATPGPCIVNEYYQCVQTHGMHKLCAVLRFGNSKDPLADAIYAATVRNAMPAIIERMEALERVAEAARTFCAHKTAMDDIGYHNGGYLLKQAIAELDKDGK